MAALNQDETTKLRNAQAMVEYILANGYDPAKAEAGDPQAVYTEKRLKQTRSEINMVTQTKGYYPN